MISKIVSHRQILIEDVTPLVLDEEEEHEDDGHVHGNDDDHHQHPAVHGHHVDTADPTVRQPKSETMSENTLQIVANNTLRNITVWQFI